MTDDLVGDRTMQSRGCATMPQLLQVLCSPLRYKLLMCIAEQPQDVGSLARRLETRTAAISQALRQFKDAGLVTMDRDKLRHVYRLRSQVSATRTESRLMVSAVSEDGALLTLTVPVPLAG